MQTAWQVLIGVGTPDDITHGSGVLNALEHKLAVLHRGDGNRVDVKTVLDIGQDDGVTIFSTCGSACHLVTIVFTGCYAQHNGQRSKRENFLHRCFI